MNLSRRSFSLGLLAAAAAAASPALADDGAKQVTFDDIALKLMKDEKFVAEKHLTEKVEKLDGKKIRIKGYMHPGVFVKSGIKQFVLVRDNQECCFGPGAALHDCIMVDMDPGKSTDYTTRVVEVEGVFKLQEIPGFTPKERQLAIYHLQAVSAK
jgi:hypothetical protein